jgi:hypothetical protein
METEEKKIRAGLAGLQACKEALETVVMCLMVQILVLIDLMGK